MCVYLKYAHTRTHMHTHKCTHTLVKKRHTLQPIPETRQSVLHCVAVCCSVCSLLQCVAECWPIPATCVFETHQSLLHCVAVCCNAVRSLDVFLKHVKVRCSVLQCVAVCCSVLQYVAVCCSVLQCVAECWPIPATFVSTKQVFL